MLCSPVRMFQATPNLADTVEHGDDFRLVPSHRRCHGDDLPFDRLRR